MYFWSRVLEYIRILKLIKGGNYVLKGIVLRLRFEIEIWYQAISHQ